jgi:YhcH/YjgK/YiaL family protein
MILCAADQLHRYEHLHPAFRKAGEFLAREDLQTLAEGRYEIEGEALFALVSLNEGKGREKARLEAHRKYIDVQFCVSGKDVIGVRPLAECETVATPYDGTKDILFFEEPSREWISLEGDRCAVFFPEDAHAPLAGTGPCKKIVLKIKARK